MTTRVFVCCENDADCNAPCPSHPWSKSMSRPSRDPPGFDRDGKKTGPTYTRCRWCGVEPGGEHKMDCEAWRVRPKPIARGMPCDAIMPHVTINTNLKTVDLHWPDGKPLQAGEIAAGDTVEFNRETGEVISVKPTGAPATPRGGDVQD